MKRTLFLLVASLLFASFVSAQDSSMYVYGRVRERSTMDSIPFPTIQISDLNSTELPSPAVTNAKGKYEFSLLPGRDYKVSYGSEGHITRWVEIDLRNTPPGYWDDGVAMNIDMTLFKDIPDVDDALLNEATARARYDSTTNSIAWDIEYTKQMTERLNKFFKEYDQGH